MNTRYSGQNGLYSSIGLHFEDNAQLRKVLANTLPPMRLNEFLDNCHVTLISSRISVPKPTLREFCSEVNGLDIVATPIGAEYWAGHDNCGYVVVLLDSPTLVHAHELLVKCGAEHSFNEYAPHLTLCCDIGVRTAKIDQWLERLRYSLSEYGQEMRLRVLNFADL